MKKIILIALTTLLSTLIYAETSLLEVKAGYFSFIDSKMRKVYKSGGVDIQVSGTFPVCDCWSIYGSVEGFEKSGNSLCGNQKTRLFALPISLGLRLTFPLWCFCEGATLNGYGTIGPRYYLAHVHNNSSYVPRKMNANGFGGFANVGFLYNVCNFTFDLFAEYSYAPLRFYKARCGAYSETAQFGGIAFGAGVGYNF